jgi:CRISPR-associated protein Csb2
MPGFGLGIRYLNGWAMAAADGAKKEVAEWPPHPDRVFMALAAAWFETGQSPAEGKALRWLETLSAPALFVSDAEPRSASRSDRPVISYVPVNDIGRGRLPAAGAEFEKLKDVGLALIPEHRPRQARSFPVAVPHRDRAYLVWPDLDPGEHRAALTSLVRKVTHIGHSASFTQVWLEDQPPVPNWVPTEGPAKHRLRVFGPGRLEDLEQRANHAAVLAYAELSQRLASAKGKEKKRLKSELQERFGDAPPEVRRPEPGLWQGYDLPAAEPTKPAPHTVFDPALVILTLSGRHLSLPATLKLTEALRGAIQKFCPDPIPEWVSGHTADGRPSEQPHLALVPLPFVGSEHADGRLLGAALVLPRGVEPREAARCFEPLLHESLSEARDIRLYEGQWLECRMSLERRESPPWNLRPEAWTQDSTIWASVTPVALDRHFDGRDKWERAAESLKDACERIGLPRPREALLHPVSMIEGVPHARDFPHLQRKSDGGRIHHSHAVLIFDQSVRGPLLLGAGRYRGYGFFRPLRERKHG